MNDHSGFDKAGLINRQFCLAARPVGMPRRENWELRRSPVVEPAAGEVLVRVDYISLDPAMRGWMNEGRSYIRPMAIGELMRAAGVGEVIASRNPDFQVGDFLSGDLGVQSYCRSDGRELIKVDPAQAPLSHFIGVLGVPGITAYFGLLEVGQPKEGETVVVSGAAGAVGQIAGQIAKIRGCRVVGIAGGPEKCRFAVEALGFDACIDYKNENLQFELRAECRKGVDVYFDNVGGEILDTVLTCINRKARIVISGAISQYNNTEPVRGPSNYLALLTQRARMEGIVVFDYEPRRDEAVRQMVRWMGEGKLKFREHIVRGLETFPETLNMLFSGENFGKLVIQVDH